MWPAFTFNNPPQTPSLASQKTLLLSVGKFLMWPPLCLFWVSPKRAIPAICDATAQTVNTGQEMPRWWCSSLFAGRPSAALCIMAAPCEYPPPMIVDWGHLVAARLNRRLASFTPSGSAPPGPKTGQLTITSRLKLYTY